MKITRCTPRTLGSPSELKTSFHGAAVSPSTLKRPRGRGYFSCMHFNPHKDASYTCLKFSSQHAAKLTQKSMSEWKSKSQKRREKKKSKRIETALAFGRSICPQPLLSPLLSLSAVSVPSPLVLVTPAVPVSHPPEAISPEALAKQGPQSRKKSKVIAYSSSSSEASVSHPPESISPEVLTKQGSQSRKNPKVLVSSSSSGVLVPSTSKTLTSEVHTNVRKKQTPLMLQARKKAMRISEHPSHTTASSSSFSDSKGNTAISSSTGPPVTSTTTEESSLSTDTNPDVDALSHADRQLISVSGRKRVYPGDRLRSRVEGRHPITDNFPEWPWNILPDGLYDQLLSDPQAEAAIQKLKWEQKYVFLSIKPLLWQFYAKIFFIRLS